MQRRALLADNVELIDAQPNAHPAAAIGTVTYKELFRTLSDQRWLSAAIADDPTQSHSFLAR
jgi:hypothetical protein